MIRRFVNLVAENYRTGVYSLHRLDVSKHLFHQSRADARVLPFLLAEAQDKSGDEGLPMLDMLKELPPPCVKIQPSSPIQPLSREEPFTNRLHFWGLLSPRSSEDKFLCMNGRGDTMLCHADKPSVDPMPHLQAEGVDHIFFSVVRPDADAQDHGEEEKEDLYVIHNLPDRRTACLRVFRKDAAADRWRWESLPPPPFVGAPTNVKYSYTVVDGGRTICISSAIPPGIGTHCFNTVEREWRHAGDWRLPFVGGAEYVPDLALWLGFSPYSPSYNLCGTSDLNAMSADHPPKLQYVWQDIVTPENWAPAGWTKLVSLGSAIFCIARAFAIEIRRRGKFDDEWWEFEDEVTILTGIEVGRDDDGSLKVWKHKSLRYNSMYSVKRVL